MFKIRPLIILFYFLLTGFGSKAREIYSEPADRIEKIKAKMEKAFGGKENLSKLQYITYKISRQGYANNDTIRTTQLWSIHLRKPSVLKLEVTGQDTLRYECNVSQVDEITPACTNLLRARFYNFLYILTSPTVDFTWIDKTTYKGKIVDIIRVSEKSAPDLRLDVFVEENGEIITTSSISETTGRYERFADEFQYVQLEGGIRFPIQYMVFEKGIKIAEGIFSNISLNNRN